MTGNPEPPFDAPGALRLLSVPLVAGAAMAWIALSGSNTALFHVVNGWPATTGDALWANLTELGEAAAVFALAAPLVGRRPRLLWAAVLAGLAGLLISQPAKRLLMVARPARALGADAIHIIGPKLSSHSFPSGHATTAFAAAALAFALVRSRWARAAVLLVAGLVATSRLAVGAHWPLDVLGGAALGWIGGCVGLLLARRWDVGVSRTGRRLTALLPLVAAVALLLPDSSGHWVLLQPVLAGVALLFGVPGCIREWRATGGVSESQADSH
jgi:membrane-associated phospholipid phosphatase